MQAYYGLIPILLYLNTYPANCIVTTKTGDVKGQKVSVGNTEVYAYLGIPYAVPPLGELRFKEPKPVEPWKGELEATELPALCWQHFTPRIFEWLPYGKQNYSEDCLYLNIWVPTCEGSDKKAVMVWIHGGGFAAGSASLDVYDGKNLAAQGNVIVVSLNYRLNAFGFLYSGTEDAPGNVGLKDQVLALRWIKDNIEAFGGDPTQITIFGESAGSYSCSFHLISPLTEGLFERAILESGSSYNPLISRNPSEAVAFSNKFASVLGCATESTTLQTNPSEVVGCLNRLSASEVAVAERKVAGTVIISFLPMYGDNYLPKQPINEMNAGNIHNVTVFIGNVADEGSFFLRNLNPLLIKTDWPAITRNQAANYIKTMFEFVNNPRSDVIIDYYLKNVSSENNRLLVKRTYDSIGDYLLYCPDIFLSEILSTNGFNVYYYIFNHKRKIVPVRAWEGVEHFEEVPFVFGTHFFVFPGLYDSAADVEFSRRIMEAWTSFAKTGKPSSVPFGVEEWPLYKKGNPTAVELKPKRSKVKNPYIPACHFWRKYF